MENIQKKSTNLTTEKKNQVAQYLLQSLRGGELPRGTITAAASHFGVCRKTVHIVWNRALEQRGRGMPINLVSKKLGMVRAKRAILDVEKIKQTPFSQRNTIRKLSSALGISKSTVWRWKQEGVIKAHTNAIKPTLNHNNMLARLKFCLDALEYDAQLREPKFKCMEHVIHVDEKWFNMSKCDQRYYILPGEEEPYRSCQSKKFITKVMFLCAVIRPQYDEHGVLIFDGKIGMWPFTKTEAAKRNSRNRAAGTLITKPMESINKEVTKNMLIHKVIPTIKSMWPSGLSKDIIIQWDNAPPHIKNDDPDFRASASSHRFNIQLQFQPPNSPDTNVNDLGWFRSLDAAKTDLQSTNVDDLVQVVLDSFKNLSHYTLNKLFISLQANMRSIMVVKGHNNYKLCHLGKDALFKQGLLPTDLTVDPLVVKEAIRYLEQCGLGNEFEGIMMEMELDEHTHETGM